MTNKLAIDSIAVVIVNYNSGELLINCLKSLLQQNDKPDTIIVVDNASVDNSLLKAEIYQDNVQFIRLDENTGFAAANNLAISIICDCKWVALLNPDAQADPDWIRNIRYAINTNQEFDSFACCMLDYENNELIDGMGDAYHVNGKAWPINKGQALKSVNNSDSEVFSPCGGAAVYNIDLYRRLGGFDEQYFCYHEDVDFGFRLRLHGYKCMYISNAVVYHHGSAISGKGSDFSIYHAHRNLVWTYFKNMPGLLFWLTLPSHVILNFMTVMYFLFYRKKMIILKAKFDALLRIFYFLKIRKSIQKERQVSYKVLLKNMRFGKVHQFIFTRLF